MCLFVLFVVVVRLKIIIIIIGCWVLIHKNNNITDELLIFIFIIVTISLFLSFA